MKKKHNLSILTYVVASLIMKMSLLKSMNNYIQLYDNKENKYITLNK